MKPWDVLLLAAVAMLGAAQAARMSPYDSIMQEIDTLGEELQEPFFGGLGTTRLFNHVDKKKKHTDMAMITARFIVPPSMHDDFIDEWQKMAKEVEHKEKGNLMFELAKPVTDNIMFSSYGEWDSWADFMDHLDSKHLRKWTKFLSDSRITFSWKPLASPAKDAKHKRKEVDNKGKQGAHVLIRYLVHPGVHSDFIDTWQKVADTVGDDEKGNRVYNLRKSETNNYEFFVYGSWDSFEDFMDHLHSDHLHKLLDFNKENDIAWFLAPVKHY